MARLRWIYPVGAALAACATGAYADDLHGFCSDCVDNNTLSVTSTGTNPPADFGFWNAGNANSGTYVLDILTPDNGGSAPSGSFSISGSASGTASLFNTTAWTSGQLDSYLGITPSASPSNPISAWLSATQTVDSSAMGYWVFQASLGQQTLGTASGTGPMFNLGSSLPQGSLIVAFLEGTSKGNTATANSAAIFETSGGGGTGVPEPGTAGLLLIALAGFGMRFMRGAPRERVTA